MDERTREFLQRAMHLSDLEAKCPCPKLLMLALDNGITLEELRNEIWPLMDEMMDTIHAIHPRLYMAVMDRLR